MRGILFLAFVLVAPAIDPSEAASWHSNSLALRGQGPVEIALNLHAPPVDSPFRHRVYASTYWAVPDSVSSATVTLPPLAPTGTHSLFQARLVSGREDFRGTHEFGLPVPTEPVVVVAPATAFVFVSIERVQGLSLGVSPSLRIESILSDGEVVASGATETGLLVGYLGGTEVYAFQVDMPLPAARPRTVDRWMWWTVTATVSGVDQGGRLKVHVGDPYATRLVIPVDHGLTIDRVRVIEDKGVHLVRAQVHSPFGPYDVDTSTLMIEGIRADGKGDGWKPEWKVGRDSHDAPHLNVSWAVEKGEPELLWAEPLTIRAWNLQQSSIVEKKIPVPTELTPPVETPSVGFWLGLLAIAIVAMRRRGA